MISNTINQMKAAGLTDHTILEVLVAYLEEYETLDEDRFDEYAERAEYGDEYEE